MTTTNLAPNSIGLDISDELMVLATGISPLLARYLQNGSGKVATQTKHEWHNQVILPKTFTVASKTASPDTITFSGSTAPAVGYILNFTTPAGVLTGVTARVTAVSGQTVDVTFLAGAIGSVVATNIAHVISEGVPENRQYDLGGYREGDREYNYTEIFIGDYAMSGTLKAISGIAQQNTEARQLQIATQMVAQKMTRAVIYGTRFESGSIRAMRGIDEFIGSGNTVAVTTTPVAGDFDQMISQIIDKSGETGMLEIVAHSKWAPTIRAFNDRMLNITDTTVGGTVREYLSATGRVLPVNFDNNIPQNKIYVQDMGKIAMIPLQTRSLARGEPQTTRDGVSVPLTGEYTLEVQNATTSHGTLVIS